MVACAQTVDEIKKQLQTAAENDDQTLCESLLNEVRPLVTTREILEETRIGFVVNQLRRQYFKKWPALLRISREVIKSWSEIVCDETSKRPQSGASSRNTTPNVLSPSMAKLMQRGITPNTPAGRRVTSTGLQGSQQRLVSPSNGSYAPRNQVSPGEATPATNGIHKSASVGGELLKHATASLSTKPITPKENGKRKATDEVVAPSIKRTKTAAGALSISVSPGISSAMAPQTPTMSVSAARKAVQSTSELFAQMSETLPGHIDIGSDIREHEERLKREHKDEEVCCKLSARDFQLAYSLQASASYGSFGTVERKKRKYERKNQKVTTPTTPAAVASPALQTTTTVTPSAPTPPEGHIPPLVLRFNKNGLTSTSSTPVLNSSESCSSKKKYEKSIRSIPRSTTPPPVVRNQEKEREKEETKREKERQEALKRKMEEEEEDDEEVEEKPKQVLSKLTSWDSLIPTMEELQLRVKRAEKETKKVVEKTAGKTRKDPTKVQLVKNFRRPILILPYLENPTGPDFLLHKYPNSLQYYSEDNFRFGEKRPSA
ncbi:Protein CBG02468 [Caenorhabditis briggsae]|uniref:Protein CBG02468 n=1 Tax=Caenorhabditis briggsae TaxID=6238 RepID=G2J6F3_CAEBR|nr:Protein CBG02470 [Caenorhabditis briggsae]XP_045092292.1 Protein CBG02468 [Caenorhabditis briggsae]CAP24051.2 Protein CBG02470 [Caenorhabditis briggsae]CAP24053.2 Protein CBG02468 [Caenorhabditis briggsae]